jgi:hypothetical protein
MHVNVHTLSSPSVTRTMNQRCPVRDPSTARHQAHQEVEQKALRDTLQTGLAYIHSELVDVTARTNAKEGEKRACEMLEVRFYYLSEYLLSIAPDARRRSRFSREPRRRRRPARSARRTARRSLRSSRTSATRCPWQDECAAPWRSRQRRERGHGCGSGWMRAGRSAPGTKSVRQAKGGGAMRVFFSFLSLQVIWVRRRIGRSLDMLRRRQIE